MPELPEVETIVRELSKQLPGKRIIDVQVRWPRLIAAPSPRAFCEQAIGLTIQEVTRRGKFILISLPPLSLLIHLRMSGQLLLVSEDTPADKHVHVIWRFSSDEALFYRDVRKFGRLYLVRDPQAILAGLGPEPLSSEFTPQRLAELLRGQRRQIKPLLMDQHTLAGLGNIYTDESLWLAGIHPKRRAGSLTPSEIQRLHQAIRQVLWNAIQHKGTTLRDFRDPHNGAGENQFSLAVYGHQGEPCPRCGHPIERDLIGGRGTHFCPLCQPLGGPQGEKEQSDEHREAIP
ncbi:MAG: bifunctional DNA-formamidopyrimidine glycosylase/DNA-(apurinic or apyrimidinic site) lyase [Anaerolineae bacterium]|nr:bifunctional DNA-formamidopyrimidine glycosylase/DNA-(apurinic or apyrimidinic site) lyase [Anaerolineae bacterium]